MKYQERVRATELRRQGKSYKEIRTSVRVSKGTLSLWLRDIKLTPQQMSVLLRGREKSRYAGAKANQRKRIERTRYLRELGQKEAGNFYTNPLFLSGLMLYWAEGDKSVEHEVVKFTNSDPKMIVLIMRWFREFCQVPEEKFRACMHIHALHCRPDIEQYWSDLTGIPLHQFHKTQVKPTTLKHRKNPLYDGTCAISINSRDLFRRIEGWRMGILDILNLSSSNIILAPVAQRIEHGTSNPGI